MACQMPCQMPAPCVGPVVSVTRRTVAGPCPAPPCIPPMVYPQQQFVDVVRQVETVRFQDMPMPVERIREVTCPQYQDVTVVQCRDVRVPVPVNRPVPYPVAQVVTKVCAFPGLHRVLTPKLPRPSTHTAKQPAESLRTSGNGAPERVRIKGNHETTVRRRESSPES